VRVQIDLSKTYNILDISTGRMLLAFSTDNIGIKGAFDERTKDVIDEVKRKGYYISEESNLEGVNTISIPIYGGNGEVIAGLSVMCPSYRRNIANIEHEFLPVVKKSADDISRQLGFVKTPLIT